MERQIMLEITGEENRLAKQIQLLEQQLWQAKKEKSKVAKLRQAYRENIQIQNQGSGSQ